MTYKLTRIDDLSFSTFPTLGDAIEAGLAHDGDYIIHELDNGNKTGKEYKLTRGGALALLEMKS